MNYRRLGLLAALLLAGSLSAATPPAQKLLPADALFVLTVPDCTGAQQSLGKSDLGNLWREEDMKAFRDKFYDHLTNVVLSPLEKDWGWSWADWSGLFQGQMTFALLPLDHPEEAPYTPVFLLDTGSQAGKLGTNLAAMKLQWIEAGKKLRMEKIHGADFTILLTSSDELTLAKLFPALVDTNAQDDLAAPPPSRPVELLVGQSGSLLILAESREAVEKILALQGEALLTPLADLPAFQKDYAARLRDAPVYAWLNAAAWLKGPAKMAGGVTGSFNWLSVLSAEGALNTLGFGGLTTASAAWHDTPQGSRFQIFVGVPDSDRHGLLNILTTEARESGPPSFVPGDAVGFSRLRFDLPSKWKLFEGTLKDLNPDYAQLLGTILGLAGKDKDEKYDLRTELLDNLGDDLITYDRAPASKTLGNLKDAPGVFLISSPNPPRLAAAIKVALALFVPSDAMKEREFLGRKIYSATVPLMGQGGGRPIQFAAGGGYVAFSSQPSMVEEFLRDGQGSGHGLDQTPGLRQAAEAGAGMSAGLMSYSNDRENMRNLVEALRQEPVSFPEFLQLIGAPVNNNKISTLDDVDRFRAWMDFSLLPPADQIARHFNFSLWTGGFTPEGFDLERVAPPAPASN